MTETASPEREAAMAELRSAVERADIEAAKAALDRLAAAVAASGSDPTSEEVAAALEAVRLCRFGTPPSSAQAPKRKTASRRKAKSLEDLPLEEGEGGGGASWLEAL